MRIVSVRPEMKVRQLAYYVPDIEAAARAHSAAFGSGPFYTYWHVPLASSMHRGVKQPFDHSSTYGQWGDLMIEFVQLHSKAPSAISDVFGEDYARFGLHHTAVWVDDLERAIADFDGHGMPLSQLSTLENGKSFAFVDAVAMLGHMIELYERDEGLTGFYAMIRDSAVDWDGQDPIRQLGE